MSETVSKIFIQFCLPRRTARYSSHDLGSYLILSVDNGSGFICPHFDADSGWNQEPQGMYFVLLSFTRTLQQ